MLRILDLFCGAGGASAGYARAGFEVVGVDINRQSSYPYKFIRDDVFHFLCQSGKVDEIRDTFDAIHASPP